MQEIFLLNAIFHEDINISFFIGNTYCGKIFNWIHHLKFDKFDVLTLRLTFKSHYLMENLIEETGQNERRFCIIIVYHYC